MDNIFKALSDPTRRKILELLRENDLSAGEIFDQFDMTKPAISQHLNALKKAELVYNFKFKQFVFYSLNVTMMEDVMVWAFGFSGAKEEEKVEYELTS